MSERMSEVRAAEGEVNGIDAATVITSVPDQPEALIPPVNTLPARVLVVDDDPTVREVVARYLSRDGYTVLESGDGLDALELFRAERPDLVVLDLMLPGMDGLAVCQWIRRESAVPVIMLTALGEESDRVVGLEHGADDYLVKPFSPRELALRVAGVLRRTRSALVPDGDQQGMLPGDSSPPPILPAAPQLLTDGSLVVDPLARTAALGGRRLALTVREFDLLAFLLRRPGEVFTRDQLMEQVWGWTFGDSSTVTVHVRRLREKVENNPAEPTRIATVWGVGYRYDRADPAGG